MAASAKSVTQPRIGGQSRLSRLFALRMTGGNVAQRGVSAGVGGTTDNCWRGGRGCGKLCAIGSAEDLP